MLGAVLVTRLCGGSLATREAAQDPGIELCQLTALSTRYGQNPTGAPLDDFAAKRYGECFYHGYDALCYGIQIVVMWWAHGVMNLMFNPKRLEGV